MLDTSQIRNMSLETDTVKSKDIQQFLELEDGRFDPYYPSSEDTYKLDSAEIADDLRGC